MTPPKTTPIQVTLTLAEAIALHNHVTGPELVSAQDKLRAAINKAGGRWS